VQISQNCGAQPSYFFSWHVLFRVGRCRNLAVGPQGTTATMVSVAATAMHRAVVSELASRWSRSVTGVVTVEASVGRGDERGEWIKTADPGK
jgi:hypothetical protein